MIWKDKITKFIEKEVIEKEVKPSQVRPISFGFTPVTAGMALFNSQLIMSYGFDLAERLVFGCDVLRTVIRCIVWETFRNGIYIDRKFVMKCKRCGMEYDEIVEKCKVCGSDDFKEPNYWEMLELKKWIKKVNLNEQSLIELLEDIDWNLNVYDNAFLICRKEYYYDKDKRLIGTKVIEFINGDVKQIDLLFNKDGRLGADDNGNVYYLCPEHRNTIVLAKPGDEIVRCPICGKQCISAIARYRGDRNGNEMIYLGRGELLHLKKFTYGIGYGYPAVLTVMVKALVLMKMDYYVLYSYSLGRPPSGILILKANRESVAKAWKMLEEMAQRNPYMIAPLALEGTNVNRVAEWIDLSLKMYEPSLINYRDELRRTIGALFGVMPIFQGDLSHGSGLNNEGLQITVTNRAVEHEQRLFNEKVLTWMCEQLGIEDFVFKLKPHEEKDMMAQLQRIEQRLRIAETLRRLGYAVKVYEGEDGINIRLDVNETKAELMNALMKLASEYGIEFDVKNVDINMLIQKILELLDGDKKGESKDIGSMIEEMLRQKIGQGEPMGARKRAFSQNYEGQPDMKQRFDYEGMPTR